MFCLVEEKLQLIITTTFTISGSSIEMVDGWTHLGHVISRDSDDRLDIIKRCEKFIMQIHSVLCTFNQLDAIVKTEKKQDGGTAGRC